MEIIFYSTHCPKCKVLEAKLKQKCIQYTECNDVDIMLSKGLQTAPALEISDGKILKFKEANDWIKEQ